MVPMGLLLLGASFAQFKIPRPISRLPIAAMAATCVAKMVIIPIIGVFMIQGMTRNGLIDKSSKVERFVAILLSGTPPAVLYVYPKLRVLLSNCINTSSQVIVAQIYAPNGEIDTLAVSLHRTCSSDTLTFHSGFPPCTM
jgi:hypothetical protein